MASNIVCFNWFLYVSISISMSTSSVDTRPVAEDGGVDVPIKQLSLEISVIWFISRWKNDGHRFTTTRDIFEGSNNNTQNRNTAYVNLKCNVLHTTCRRYPARSPFFHQSCMKENTRSDSWRPSGTRRGLKDAARGKHWGGGEEDEKGRMPQHGGGET